MLAALGKHVFAIYNSLFQFAIRITDDFIGMVRS